MGLHRFAASLFVVFIGYVSGGASAQTGEIDVRRGVEYVVHGGQSLKGDLYTPRAPGTYPAVIGIHGGGWQLGSAVGYQLTRPRDHIVEKFLGVSLIDNRRAYFDASPLSYVAANNNRVSFLLAWGTHDDIVPPALQSERFMEALKQARYFVRPAIQAGAPHFWLWDPIDWPTSQSGWLAPRLLEFLRARL